MTPVKAKRPDAGRFSAKKLRTGFLTWRIKNCLKNNFAFLICFTAARPCENFTRFPYCALSIKKRATKVF